MNFSSYTKGIRTNLGQGPVLLTLLTEEVLARHGAVADFILQERSS